MGSIPALSWQDRAEVSAKFAKLVEGGSIPSGLMFSVASKNFGGFSATVSSKAFITLAERNL